MVNMEGAATRPNQQMKISPYQTFWPNHEAQSRVEVALGSDQKKLFLLAAWQPSPFLSPKFVLVLMSLFGLPLATATVLPALLAAAQVAPCLPNLSPS